VRPRAKGIIVIFGAIFEPYFLLYDSFHEPYLIIYGSCRPSLAIGIDKPGNPERRPWHARQWVATEE
jgi:hypothetical protein